MSPAPAEEASGLSPMPPILIYIEAARAAMPGYQDTQAALRRVQRQLTQPLPDQPRYPDVPQLVAAAIAGEPVPDDLAEQVLRADRLKSLEDTRRLWTQSVVSGLEDELQQVVMREVDSGLRFLDRQLQLLLAAAAEAISTAAGIRTAEDALRAQDDQREAFVRLDELTRRLALLRDAQRDLMRNALDWMSDSDANSRELLRYAGTVANLAEVVPDWQDAQRGAGRGMVQGVGDPDREQHRLTPWRQHAREPLMPVIDTDHLVWLVESPAIPWVPTVAEARMVTDRLLHPEPPPRTDAEKAATARAERRFDEVLAAHAREWRYREQLGYGLDGWPLSPTSGLPPAAPSPLHGHRPDAPVPGYPTT